MLGAALTSTLSLVLWSLTPSRGTGMIPRVMPIPMLLDISRSQLGKLNSGGGEEGRCVCGRKSGSVLGSQHSGIMDGNGYSSFKDSTQPSSLHSLDVTLPSPRTRQPVLHRTMQQQAEHMTGSADRWKEVKRDGTFKQQLISVVGHEDGRERSVFQSLKQGKMVKETLVVAVIIGGAQLKWAESVYATWGRDTSQLVFYVESHSNINIKEATSLGLQFVELHSSGNVHTRLALLQHLGEHYMKSHQWFVVVTEDTYVRMDQLEAVLGRLSPDDPLILGLPPHCQLRRRGTGSSVVMNQALLALLTQQLHLCRYESMEVADSLDSMEACVGKHLNIHCSISPMVSADCRYMGHPHCEVIPNSGSFTLVLSTDGHLHC